MKKEVLIVYPSMMIGGSTTSLLSLLSSLDYTKYNVEFLLLSQNGELLHEIPEKVKLIPPARMYTSNRDEFLHKIFSLLFWYYFIISKIIKLTSGEYIQAYQYLSTKDQIYKYRSVDKKYDVAVSFLEGPCAKFVSKHIFAKKKIAWIHINYLDGKLNPKYDLEDMTRFDDIVLVSKDCQEAYNIAFPGLASRTHVIENILSQAYIRKRAREKESMHLSPHFLNIVTVCRISFISKGLDRAVKAMRLLKKKTKNCKLKWYIVGGGGDFNELKKLISAYRLEDTIFLLGAQKNAIPYLKGMDLFFLPSRFEGKPMAVTEAKMMGLPCLVTEYSSAREQIEDEVEGKIVPNSFIGIFEGLCWANENDELIKIMKNKILNRDYTNTEEIKKVEDLFDKTVNS